MVFHHSDSNPKSNPNLEKWFVWLVGFGGAEYLLMLYNVHIIVSTKDIYLSRQFNIIQSYQRRRQKRVHSPKTVVRVFASLGGSENAQLTSGKLVIYFL